MDTPGDDEPSAYVSVKMPRDVYARLLAVRDAVFRRGAEALPPDQSADLMASARDSTGRAKTIGLGTLVGAALRPLERSLALVEDP